VLPEELIEAFEERAAILEYDAGMPREEAERRAREMVLNQDHVVSDSEAPSGLFPDLDEDEGEVWG